MKVRNFAILFFVYLSVYLWLKVINEISFHSIQYFADLSELLFLVIITGLSYYLYLLVSKRKDYLEENLFTIDLKTNTSLFISIIAGLVVATIVDIKIEQWDMGNFIVTFATFIFSTICIYFSLVEK